VNEQVDLNIVVCTGVYAFMELPQFLRYRTVEALTAIFVRELTEGIDDSGVKAAFIKCAVEEHGLVGDVPRILAAVAAAAAETGAPVMAHTNGAARSGLVSLEALTAAGVPPEKLVIAHVGDSNDLDHIRRLAASGAYLGWDRFNIEHFNPDANRIETLCAALAAGDVGVDQIHFSHDGATFHDFMVGARVRGRGGGLPPPVQRDAPAAPRARHLGRRHRPDHGRQPAPLACRLARTRHGRAGPVRGTVPATRV